MSQLESRPESRAELGLSIDVCICTYERPELEAAIRSVATQRGVEGRRLELIVADNHAEPRAEALAERLAAELALPIRYLHAPARNISVARNACLAAAQGDLIAFLDDDEVADPMWLAALVREALEGGWDAVLGPVRAIYAADAPDWIRAGDFHSVRPVWVGGEIRTGYTCNVLIRREALKGLTFNPAYGRSGGEDLDFFYRFTDAGGRIGYAEDALVRELAPAQRTTFDWLVRRRFRSGQSHGARLLQIARRPFARVLALALAGMKAAAYGLMTLVSGLDPVRRRRFMLGAAMHAGVVARLAGARPIELY